MKPLTGFDFFEVDENEPPPAVPEGLAALRELRRDDLFRVGGKGPTFRVVQSYGDTMKTAVKEGTAGRVLYVVQGVTSDYQVEVYPTSGGSLDRTGPSVVPAGIARKVEPSISENKKAGFNKSLIRVVDDGRSSFIMEGEDASGRGGFIRVRQRGDVWNVDEIEVSPEGEGIGTAFWEAAAAEAARRGGRLGSNYRVSSAADEFWEKQYRKGRATRVEAEADENGDEVASLDQYVLKEGVRSLKNNPSTQLPRAQASFDRHFDVLAQQFPDYGALELHLDENAGGDNGHGSERQFGYCTVDPPFCIAFAAKIEQMPDEYIDGLMAHEFGHAIDHRYGRKALEAHFGKRLPDSVERRADKIAEYVFGRPIEYGQMDVQCIDCGGKAGRPRRLG